MEAVIVKRINTVDEAIRLFLAVAEGLEPDFNSIEFGPDFDIEFRLPRYSSEMPSQFIQAYHATYRRLYQLIALLENGRADAKTLTNDQREKYAFTVKVKEGSSKLEDNGPELLQNALGVAFNKMSGRQAVLTVLGTALIGFTAWGFTAYVDAQKSVRTAEINSQEKVEIIDSINTSKTKDLEVFATIIERMQGAGEAGRSAVKAVTEIHDERLRAMSETDETHVDELVITGEQARTLRSSTRRKSVEVTAQQEMRVVDVNTADPAAVTVVLEDVETGEQTKLRYSDAVRGAALNDLIHEALKNRSTALFTLKGKVVDGVISYSEIEGAVNLPDIAAAEAE